MTALRIVPESGARNLIDDAIAANGASRVLLAAALAVFRSRDRRRPRPPDAGSLSAHLRRDVGLMVEPEAADWRHFIG